MGDKNKSIHLNHEETTPTCTIAAAFILSIVLGVIVISGVLQKPYEAREVVESLHEKIIMQKEYRELSRMNHTATKVAFSKPEQVAFPESNLLVKPSIAITSPTSAKATAKKTDRAESFDRTVKSDEYWKSLQASIAGIKRAEPSSTPVVIPPVVVGSAE